MIMEPVIRPSSQCDHTALGALLRQAAGRSELSHADGVLPEDALEGLLAGMPPRFVNLAAVDGSDVIGCAFVTRLYQRKAWDPTADVYVVVDPARRRQGIGSALLRAALDHGTRNGIRSMVCITRGHSRWLADWCSDAGFARAGQLPCAGEAQPMVVLQLLVGEGGD